MFEKSNRSFRQFTVMYLIQNNQVDNFVAVRTVMTFLTLWLTGLGSYNKRFAAAWEPLVKGSFGADGSTLGRMKFNDFMKLVADLWGKMEKNLEPKKTQAMKLLDFSTWLAEFEHSDQTSPEVSFAM